MSDEKFTTPTRFALGPPIVGRVTLPNATASLEERQEAESAVVDVVRRFLAENPAPVVPVAVRLSSARVRLLEEKFDANAAIPVADVMGSPRPLHGLRVEEVANAEDLFGEVEYSDGSRRPI